MSDTEKRIQALEARLAALIENKYIFEYTTTVPVPAQIQPDLLTQTERAVNAALAKCHAKITEEMTYQCYSEDTVKALKTLDEIIMYIVDYIDENHERCSCIDRLLAIHRCVEKKTLY